MTSLASSNNNLKHACILSCFSPVWLCMVSTNSSQSLPKKNRRGENRFSFTAWGQHYPDMKMRQKTSWRKRIREKYFSWIKIQKHFKMWAKQIQQPVNNYTPQPHGVYPQNKMVTQHFKKFFLYVIYLFSY